MPKHLSPSQSNAMAKAATLAGKNDKVALETARRALQATFPEWRWRVEQSQTIHGAKTGNFTIKTTPIP